MLVIIRRSDEIMVGAGIRRVEMTQILLEFLIEMRSVNIHAAALPGEAKGGATAVCQSIYFHLLIVFHRFCKKGKCLKQFHFFWTLMLRKHM